MPKGALEKYSSELQKKIVNLPQVPGVYIMRDERGEVIYVGKAVNLKNRVRQYFTHEQQLPKVAAMVSVIHDFEYIITDTELEALVLECNMIKRYRPRYNIMLKDDKHFPYLRVDLREDYPRIEVVRSVKDDGAKYFGPFIAAHVLQDMLDQIYRVYPLRSCRKDVVRAAERQERPCINRDMGRCIAPCTGKVSKEAYREMLDEVISLVSGQKLELRKELHEQMLKASEDLNFELAATLRDKIALLDRVREKQRAGFPNLTDKDIFAVETGSEQAVVQMFLVRDGKLSYAEKFYLDYSGEDKTDIMEMFLMQYYTDKGGIPRTVYALPRPTDGELLEQWLTEKKGSSVQIRETQSGDARKLMELAQRNARDALKLKESAEKIRERAARNLADAIGFEGDVHRIECYDISNTQGTDNVASMVVFRDGRPDRKAYRRFRIKGFEGANDFASLNEALTRRFRRGLDGDKGFSEMPDLVVIDGGKGQLSAAMEALESLGLTQLRIVSLAKREEEIFVPGREEPVLLTPGTPEFRLITSVRDEAHRFAITYHRKLREKRIHKSVLDDVPGIGEVRKKQLLRHFGSLKRLKEASLEDIKACPGIPGSAAEAVYGALHTPDAASAPADEDKLPVHTT